MASAVATGLAGNTATIGTAPAAVGAANANATATPVAEAGAGVDPSVTGRPLKIALLTHSVNPRGGVVHTLELAQALHAAGHDVTVLAPAWPLQTMFRTVACRLQLVPLRRDDGNGAGDGLHGSAGVAAMVASRIAAFERHLAALLAREPFDVLHAQDPIGANALANLQDRGLVAGFARTVHHLDPFDGPTAADRRLAAWQRRGFERAAQVACVSRLWCEVLREGHGIDAALVHNGVDCARFTPHADDGDARVVARYGLRNVPPAGPHTRSSGAGGAGGAGGASGPCGPSGTSGRSSSSDPGGRPHPRDERAPVVLAVGGVESRKNTCRLVDAFALLRAERPGARLLIAGGASLLDHDAYAAEFRARVEAAGLSIGHDQAVVMTGTLPDAEMPALYRAADVLAMPSLREGFGLAVLEALACGTPVVASRIAPFTEYLNLNGDGTDASAIPDCTWADPLDAASIASALRNALAPANAAAVRAAAADGPPALCRRFGWPASAARHVALYRACAALGRPLSTTAPVERRAATVADRRRPGFGAAVTAPSAVGAGAPRG